MASCPPGQRQLPGLRWRCQLPYDRYSHQRASSDTLTLATGRRGMTRAFARAFKLATDRQQIWERIQLGFGAVGKDSPIGPAFGSILPGRGGSTGARSGSGGRLAGRSRLSRWPGYDPASAQTAATSPIWRKPSPPNGKKPASASKFQLEDENTYWSELGYKSTWASPAGAAPSSAALSGLRLSLGWRYGTNPTTAIRASTN